MLTDEYFAFEKMKYLELNILHNFTVLGNSLCWNHKGFYEDMYPGLFPIHCLSISKQDDQCSVFSWDHFKEASRIAFHRHWKEDNFFEWMHREQKQAMEKIDQLYILMKRSFFKKNSFIVIKKKVQEIIDAELFCNAYGWFSLFGEKEEYLKWLKEVKSTIPEKRASILIDQAVTTPIISFEQRNALTIKKCLETSDDIFEDCEYMVANFNGIMAKSDALQVFRETLESAPSGTKEFSINTENAEEERLVSFIIESILMRDHLRDYLSKTITIVYRFASFMLENAGISQKHIDNCVVEELYKGVDYISSIASEIEKRKDGVVVLFRNNGSFAIEYNSFEQTYAQVSKHIAQFYLQELNQSGVIKGNPASKGVAKGEVKIIMNLKSEKAKFKHGNILVTGMTRPEFVPLMKIAAAIVTNEGGVTSHAAIISRELGKPCVIGTKVATALLKDGDFVEVDAFKGVVRKID